MKRLARAALIRAARTFFQTILGLWTAGLIITQVDWHTVLIAAVSAAVYSLLTSIVAGLPEVENDGIGLDTDEWLREYLADDAVEEDDEEGEYDGDR